MRIGGIYSLKNGRAVIEDRYAQEFQEVQSIITAVNSSLYLTKISQEKTMVGRRLYRPRALNRAFKAEFLARSWHSHKVFCEYSNEEYLPDYTPTTALRGAFREIDFVKNRVGVEVQFGKYAFMVYNVCAKMTIFSKLNVIDVGIEIVPTKDFAATMSTGVSSFEQFVWDLKNRGEADIDIPVLILGVTD